MQSGLDKKYLHSWVDVDTGAIADNIRFLAERAKRYKKEFMLMVKADAYGHGLLEISRLAEGLGSVFLGVSSLEEAITLRENGIQAPVLLFSQPPLDSLPLLREHRIVPAVGSLPLLRALIEQTGGALPFHIKINSGLSRYGFDEADMPEVLKLVKTRPENVQGILTHYSCGDDAEQTRREFDHFWNAVGQLRKAGCTPRYTHASNSPATAWFDETQTNLVRLGLAAYGLQPSDARELPLKPALSWYTRLSAVSRLPKGKRVGYGGNWEAARDSVVGVMHVGYSDGFRRGPQPQQYVLCRGQRLPVIGRVMMNHAILDLTDAADQPEIGDEIVIVGRQGTERLSLEMVGAQIGTSNEEVVTNISAHLQRFFLQP